VYNLWLAVTKFVVQTDKGYSITNVNEFIQQCQLFGESVINLGNDKSIGDALATNMLTKNTNFLNLLTTFKSTRLNT
jgi:hypothetical protein